MKWNSYDILKVYTYNKYYDSIIIISAYYYTFWIFIFSLILYDIFYFFICGLTSHLGLIHVKYSQIYSVFFFKLPLEQVRTSSKYCYLAKFKSIIRLHWGQRFWFQPMKTELWNKHIIQIFSWILYNGNKRLINLCIHGRQHCTKEKKKDSSLCICRTLSTIIAIPSRGQKMWLWKWQPCHHYLIIPTILFTIIRRDR